jgi:hypothetical protein
MLKGERHEARKRSHAVILPGREFLAERGGFEPPIGYEPIHAFQACDLNHSSISPDGFTNALVREAAYYSKDSRQYKSATPSC